MPDLILPVLDEAAAIPWVLHRVPTGWTAIVVDNGSSDRSGAIARSLGATVVVEPRRGFGAACWAGLLAATADVVCFMDCDGSLDPRDAVRVVAPVEAGTADLVMARRMANPGAWPWHAALANGALARVVGGRAGAPLHDLGPMRAARREPLLGLSLEDRGFGWPFEMALRAAAAGWRIQEAAVAYRQRVGRSKVTGTVSGSLRAARDTLRVTRAVRRTRAPGLDASVGQAGPPGTVAP